MGANALKGIFDAISGRKALNETQFSYGGALVGTNVLMSSMIELLRNKPLVSQMGAMSLSGIVGNVAIPAQSGGATTYWLSETGSGTESDQQFAQLGLTPKRLVGDTAYSKELIAQTDLSVEGLVRDDLTRVLAIAKDLAALYGTGGSQPLGLTNTVGVNSTTFGGTATRQAGIALLSEPAQN
jgi:HK97 family phage major capsid protein